MKKIYSIFLLLLLLIFADCLSAQPKIELIDSTKFNLPEGLILQKISFRGLSVVDDKVIWASGNLATIAKSIDGGKTFQFTQIKGYEKSDFRDIEAFDDKRAVIMCSGSPSYILTTNDGGQNWKEVYSNTDTACFLDAMDFWDNKNGMVIGDPIHGHFFLMRTKDGGETWQELDTSKIPESLEGESLFAASGTSLKCWNPDYFGFVTGGKYSRLLYYSEKMDTWYAESIQIAKGSASKGAFSFTLDESQFHMVGGDYLNDTSGVNACASITYFDEGFSFPENVNGYRSCIEMIGEFKFIAVGTNGVDYLLQFKKTGWQKISNLGFHVVKKAKKGKAVFVAGSKGKIGKLDY